MDRRAIIAIIAPSGCIIAFQNLHSVLDTSFFWNRIKTYN